jgi:NAD+ synthase
VKVTQKSFGRDRRYPITNRFRDDGRVPPVDGGALPQAARTSTDLVDF